MVPLHARRGRDTVASVLREQALRHADEPFLVFEPFPDWIEEITWAQMLARAERTASVLHGLGVGRGDRIGVHLPSCPEYFDVWFAAALLGAAVVPTLPQAGAVELADRLRRVRCRICVMAPDSEPAAIVAAEECAPVALIDGTWIERDGMPPEIDVQPTDVLGVLYSQGGSGPSRGVLVTHAAYLHVGDVLAEHIRFQPSDRALIVSPMAHAHAQYYLSMPALVTGASIALTSQFSSRRWAEQATTLGATVAGLFASSIRMILAQPPSAFDRAHGLRQVLFVQDLTDEELGVFEDRFDVPMAHLYGTTETVAPQAATPAFGDRRGRSLGRPISSAFLRVVDADGSDVAAGECGELLVGGEPGRTLMLGYLNDPEETAAVLHGGWLHTGDVVRFDADGYLFLAEDEPAAR